ncbi:hypothetical protein HMPREF0322_00782 [Desulfitobacterium hafniense DP7]|uniref:YcdB/YcdC repeated domain-containing protein n=1 Tax=Desulfitobacterium hafniense DP7 TaxID=537010 RepID=G9XIK6_DESHA|nr:YcdB/YcdC domain-containing protein [Desulfitobacterium hafniense]EHL08470.1 hypothetical protein HMPREF0322_00782 [Desulfitobacterium hafniense DP7]
MTSLPKKELLRIANSVVKIPDDYELTIEDYLESENAEGEAIFLWTGQKRDEAISVHLDAQGNLTYLSIDRQEKEPAAIAMDEVEKRKCAELFLCTHYPDAWKDLTFSKTKKLSHADRFYYEQIVMGLPLEHAGCYMDIGSLGEVVTFSSSYKGVRRIPEIPSTLISKEKLKEHIGHTLQFRLKIHSLHSEVHDVEQDGLYLVYEPNAVFQTYRAADLSTETKMSSDEGEGETYVPLPTFSLKKVRQDLGIAEVVGITENLEMIREVDMGKERGIVWRDRNWQVMEKDLSMDGFFRRQTEDTVKAFVSKRSGKVRSFIWFMERKGDRQLTREECYTIAIEFLEWVIPEYFGFLQLTVPKAGDENEEQENWDDDIDDDIKEAFVFTAHNGHGIPVDSIVTVTVNRTTGLVDYYNGPDFDSEQLQQLPIKPALTEERAKEIFMSHLDFELKWDHNYGEEESDTLVYRLCDVKSRTPIRYIDAITGEVRHWKRNP